jgi:DNA-binding SARP family transcriptional activator
MERKLFLFGNPRLEQDGISLEIGRSEAMALLAYLALESQLQNQDELITLLWPESDHKDGLFALRKNLSLLNEFLGHDWSHVDKTLIGLNPDLGL